MVKFPKIESFHNKVKAAKTDWITHDSNDPPELAPAALIRLKCPEGGKAVLLTVWDVDWLQGVIYSPVTDEDGISYCSAVGLIESTKYVTTAENGAVFQWIMKPRLGLGSPGYWVGVSHALCDGDHRHPGDWWESLYRVWRG